MAAPGVRVGCAGLVPRVGRSEIFDVVTVLEEHALTREPAPSLKTLRRWQRDTPDGASYALVAAPGLFDGGDDAVEDARSAVEALGAEVLLLRPPVTTGPSQVARDRLRELVRADLCPGGEVIFWPVGLWDAQTTLALVDELEIPAVINPLASDPQDQDRALWLRELGRSIAYLRLDRLAGARRRFDDYELDEIADLVDELERGWVIFCHSEALRDAHALREKLADR